MKALPTSTLTKPTHIEYVTVQDVTPQSLPYSHTNNKEIDYSFIYYATAFVLTCVVGWTMVTGSMIKDYPDYNTIEQMR